MPTIESTIYEQVWRCLVNYEPEKSKGKLTTMICKYIRNAVRNIAQSNNYQKRSVNNLVNCSSLDAFESGEDKVQETGELAEYGIVRNHFYKITLSGIKGFGTPVYDPAKVVVPAVPTYQDTYLAARVQVLQWRLVTQSASLGN